MRKSTVYLAALLVCGCILMLLLFVHPAVSAKTHGINREKRRVLVCKLKLTDLCLFTEARYTRNLSQADMYSAFQDHPMSFEHFPSGSLTRPPALLDRKRP